MVTSTEFRDELLALKADAARVLGTAGEELRKSSRDHTDKLAEQLRSAFDELGQNLARDEKQIAKLVADRPVAALGCALAAGILIGLALRRI